MTQTRTGTPSSTQTPTASPVFVDEVQAAAEAAAASSAQFVPLAAGLGSALVIIIIGGVAFRVYERKVRADLRMRKLKAAARAVSVRSIYGAVASEGGIAVRAPAAVPSVVLYQVGGSSASSASSGGRGSASGQSVSVVVGSSSGGGGGGGGGRGGAGAYGGGGSAYGGGGQTGSARFGGPSGPAGFAGPHAGLTGPGGQGAVRSYSYGGGATR